jgi:hypothetical protein
MSGSIVTVADRRTSIDIRYIFLYNVYWFLWYCYKGSGKECRVVGEATATFVKEL